MELGKLEVKYRQLLETHQLDSDKYEIQSQKREELLEQLKVDVKVKDCKMKDLTDREGDLCRKILEKNNEVSYIN